MSANFQYYDTCACAVDVVVIACCAGAGCAPNTHLCYVSYPEFRCLPLTQVCDGEINCVGATDEANCG